MIMYKNTYIYFKKKNFKLNIYYSNKMKNQKKFMY